MAGKITEAGELAKEMCARFPNAPTKTLARRLYNEHPQRWKSVEATRDLIRNYRGNHGSQQRKHLTDKSHVRPNAKSTVVFRKLPEPIKQLTNFNALHLDDPGEILLLNDVHVPFHDKAACLAAINEGKRHKVKTVVLNGDIADCYRVSDFRKDARLVDFWEEIAAVVEFLGFVRHTFKKARIVYKWGNHEERYFNWMLVKAPELLDIADFDFARVFKFDQFGIEEVKDRRAIMFGKLWCLHGHEFQRGISAPVNPGRGLFLRAYESAIQGDCHRSSHHPEMTLGKHLISCWTVGCLCDLQPAYAPYNKWNHGCAIVHVAKGGAYEVENYRIINGVLYR